MKSRSRPRGGFACLIRNLADKLVGGGPSSPFSLLYFHDHRQVAFEMAVFVPRPAGFKVQGLPGLRLLRNIVSCAALKTSHSLRQEFFCQRDVPIHRQDAGDHRHRRISHAVAPRPHAPRLSHTDPTLASSVAASGAGRSSHRPARPQFQPCEPSTVQ